MADESCSADYLLGAGFTLSADYFAVYGLGGDGLKQTMTAGRLKGRRDAGLFGFRPMAPVLSLAQ